MWEPGSGRIVPLRALSLRRACHSSGDWGGAPRERGSGALQSGADETSLLSTAVGAIEDRRCTSPGDSVTSPAREVGPEALRRTRGAQVLENPENSIFRILHTMG